MYITRRQDVQPGRAGAVSTEFAGSDRQDQERTATNLKYRDKTIVRFVSTRTDETLLELKMVEHSLIVWGVAPRDRFECRLNGSVIELDGQLCDSEGPVLRAADGELAFLSGVRIDVEDLADESPLERETMRGGLVRE